MPPEATTATIDTDELPPVRYLIMEVLAARYRTGEATWTFPARFRRSLEALAGLGLIGYKSGVAPGTHIAWLTDEGKAASMSDTYVPPNDRPAGVTAYCATGECGRCDLGSIHDPCRHACHADARP